MPVLRFEYVLNLLFWNIPSVSTTTSDNSIERYKINQLINQIGSTYYLIRIAIIEIVLVMKSIRVNASDEIANPKLPVF